MEKEIGAPMSSDIRHAARHAGFGPHALINAVFDTASLNIIVGPARRERQNRRFLRPVFGPIPPPSTT